MYLLVLSIAVIFGYYFYKRNYSAPKINPNQILLSDLNGTSFQLSAFKGKRVVLCFSASWCGNCISELQTIASLSQSDLAEFEVVVISDESVEKIRRFKEKNAFPFTFLKLKSSFADIGIHSIPTTYLLNTQLNVVKETVGYLNWNDASNLEHFKRIMD